MIRLHLNLTVLLKELHNEAPKFIKVQVHRWSHTLMALWEGGRNLRGGLAKENRSFGHVPGRYFLSSDFLPHSPPPVSHEMKHLVLLHAP